MKLQITNFPQLNTPSELVFHFPDCCCFFSLFFCSNSNFQLPTRARRLLSFLPSFITQPPTNNAKVQLISSFVNCNNQGRFTSAGRRVRGKHICVHACAYMWWPWLFSMGLPYGRVNECPTLVLLLLSNTPQITTPSPPLQHAVHIFKQSMVTTCWALTKTFLVNSNKANSCMPIHPSIRWPLLIQSHKPNSQSLIHPNDRKTIHKHKGTPSELSGFYFAQLPDCVLLSKLTSLLFPFPRPLFFSLAHGQKKREINKQKNKQKCPTRRVIAN